MRRNSRDFSRISPGADIVLNAMFLLYAALCVLPFLLILGISLSDEKSIVEYGYRIIPVRFSMEAYRFVASQSLALLRSYGITLYATVAGTALSVAITALFAYPLSRKDFRYRNLFSFIVFFTMIFQGGLVAGYMVYVGLLGLKNTLVVYLMPFMMNAFNVILMRTFMTTSIPESLVEAARIDGASEMRTFLRIILPLSLPGLATIALFTSIGIWNDWFTPLMYITKPELFNLQYSMYVVLRSVDFLKSNSNMAGEATKILQNLPTQSVRMAMCVVSIGPIIFAYPFFQKYYIKGLTVGAIKG